MLLCLREIELDQPGRREERRTMRKMRRAKEIWERKRRGEKEEEKDKDGRGRGGESRRE